MRQQKAIASGEQVVVRKNKYRVEEEEDVESRIVLHKPDTEAVKGHIEKLRKVKAERDNTKVRECLDRISQAAKGEENLMPYLIEAAKAYTSIGEITKTLKEVWGQYREPSVI